ncbi:hypothetical protein JNUCC32_12525 [Paenibacillus sp. JNUCC32]|uniref:MAE_28990/MAE_18760 family HEPN-like nuclease n=1 Tax=Paenibacillus sp. JNUCC32 TaxID=2777984 RepID=UPI00178842E7|nr:MAE_28990/MAE_18760 family HEPN-like nuclease [Paenibacillus sp. JNUCC-32]QOT12790.1 hypothetical protein JNUCC32_12525 [Paenibacillus sp. JNUCC-32]
MNFWKLKYKIESYLNFFNKITIKDVSFYRVDAVNYAELKVDAQDIQEAEKQGEMKLQDVLSAMEFTLNERINFHVMDIQQEKGDGKSQFYGASNLASAVAVRVPFPETELENINDIFTGINNSNNIGTIAYQSYLKGIEVGEWYNEAFLNFFKAIEVIANTYLEAGKREKEISSEENLKSLVKDLEDYVKHKEDNLDKLKKICTNIHSLGFIELKMKIDIALMDLGLSEYSKEANKLVNFRNKFVAHGSSNKIIKIQELEKCKSISKMMIKKYIEKNHT